MGIPPVLFFQHRKGLASAAEPMPSPIPSQSNSQSARWEWEAYFVSAVSDVIRRHLRELDGFWCVFYKAFGMVIRSSIVLWLNLAEVVSD